MRQQTDDFFRLDQDTADFEVGDAFTRLVTSDGDVKIIFSHPHFSNQNPRQMVHLVLDDLGREPREFQRLRLEIHVLEFPLGEGSAEACKKEGYSKEMECNHGQRRNLPIPD